MFGTTETSATPAWEILCIECVLDSWYYITVNAFLGRWKPPADQLTICSKQAVLMSALLVQSPKYILSYSLPAGEDDCSDATPIIPGNINFSSCAAMRMGSDEQGLLPGGRLPRLAFNNTSHYFFLRSNAQSVGQTRTTDSERKYDAEDDELHGKCVQSSEMPEKSLPILLELYVSSKNCRIMTYVGSNESWGPQLHAAPHEKALRRFRAATDRSMHAPFRGATHVRDSALALFDRSCHVTEVPTCRAQSPTFSEPENLALLWIV